MGTRTVEHVLVGSVLSGDGWSRVVERSVLHCHTVRSGPRPRGAFGGCMLLGPRRHLADRQAEAADTAQRKHSTHNTRAHVYRACRNRAGTELADQQTTWAMPGPPCQPLHAALPTVPCRAVLRPAGPGVGHSRACLRGRPQVQGARQQHLGGAAGLARSTRHWLHRRHDQVGGAGPRCAVPCCEI